MIIVKSLSEIRNAVKILSKKVKRVMDRVAKGDYKVQEHFPQEVKTAVEAFFRATEIKSL